MTSSASIASPGNALGKIRPLVPGVLLSAGIAVAATAAAPLVARVLPIPAMVIALILGIALGGQAQRPLFAPGLVFCVKKLLRWAVALLGLRVALGDIVGLGGAVAGLVIVGMAVTLVSGFVLARLLGKGAGFGALAGAATAVCGASATLATSTVVPNYPGKEADIAFVVVAVNALSTLAMVAYPPLCVALGFDPQTAGVMLGATIHDVAQVVGAGYAMGEATGNTAVIVKLFRVFLLLPTVLIVGWWFARSAVDRGAAKVPVPVFAIVFLVLCLINSLIGAVPGVAPVYGPARTFLIDLSNWGLLIAISALGLGTSLRSIAVLGWSHVATVTGTTIVLLCVATAGLLVLR